MDILDTRQNLNAMVLCHEQQIKDIATHLLELKRLVTPMMEFKQDAAAKADYERGFDDGFILRKEKDGKRTWVGLTGVEINYIFAVNVGYPERMMQEVEALLKDKNT